MPVEPIDVVFVHGVRSSGNAWDVFLRLIESDPELGPLVRPHVFDYDTRLFSLRPGRRIAEIDDIADRLGTFLSTGSRASARTLVIVTHSQGGLVVQRFLVRTLQEGRGLELGRIKRICMYACPNTGAQFLLSLRRKLFLLLPNPQERELRPEHRRVIETLRAVQRDVVNAPGCTANKCHIPIASHGGDTDDIVPAHIARSVFPEGRTVTGDHRTIIRPADGDVDSYQVLRQALLAVTHGEPTASAGGSPDSKESRGERQGPVTVDPPFGRREGSLHGRDGIIREITADTQSRVHVLAGLGGVGKTRIALEIAHRERQAGHDVWWINLTRIDGCMREMAQQLGIPESRINVAWANGSEASLIWRALQERSTPWLLVFDQADDPERLAGADGPVSDGTGWLRAPTGHGGTVVVTTRDGNSSTWGTWCAVHQVRPLEDGDGAAMLMERAPEGGTREEARQLSSELGGLPLALFAAARCVKSESGAGRVWTGSGGIRSFSSYREAVRERFRSAAGAPQARNAGQTLGLDQVRQVFELSLELLTRRGLPDAAPLLKLLACFGTDPVPYSVLLKEAGLGGTAILPDFSADRRQPLLEGLADVGLIRLDDLSHVDDPNLSHVLSLHPVVQGIFRDDQDVRDRRADYYGVTLELLLAAMKDYDPDYPESWGVWPLLVPHTVAVCRAALLGPNAVKDHGVTAQALELARMTCRYLIVAGITERAEDLVAGVIDNLPTLGYGLEDREILGLRHEKGRIAIARGQPAVAEAELREVVAGRTRVLGERTPDTLASRHKLARAILEQSRWAEAEAQLASIVEDERSVRGYEHSDTIVVRHSLARAIVAQGRHVEAEAMLREIRDVQLRTWAPNMPETLFVQLTLAGCLLDQGRTAEAGQEIRDALLVIGNPHDVLVVLQLQFRHMLALVLLASGEIDQAIEVLRSVLTDREKMLGREHPDTRRTRAELDRVTQIP